IFGRIHRRLEDETIRCRITQRINGFDVDTAAPLATCQAEETCVCYVPVAIDDLEFARFNREEEIQSQDLEVRDHTLSEGLTKHSFRGAEVRPEKFRCNLGGCSNLSAESRSILVHNVSSIS